ncbi:YbjN domain-containing protein [Methanomassiliicoccaceae archaeon COG_1]|nr:YbjN domain-containing protein [Methanomassiliicoccaceae archaeon COG_1]
MSLLALKKNRPTSPSAVYGDLCKALDGEGIKYKTDANIFTVYSTFQGDDLPIKVEITVDKENPFLCFNSLLDLQAPIESYKDILNGLNELNAGLHFGAFILDPESGRVMYRYHFMFAADYRPSQDLINGILSMVVSTVDEHDGDLKRLIPENTHFVDPMFG